MLPRQRQSHLGQRRDVPGAHRSELVDDRIRPALQRLAQRGDHGRPQPRTPGQQLVGADGEHRADLAGGQLLPDGAGVAAQQPEAVLGGRFGGHVLVPVGADAGGAAVDASGRGDLPGGVPGLRHPLHRVAPGFRTRRPVGEAHDVLDPESDPVEDHWASMPGRHSTSRVHDLRRHHAQTPLKVDIRSCLAFSRYVGLTPNR